MKVREAMKKIATQSLILLVATTVVMSTFAQSPNATRQRRSGADGTQQASDNATKAADDKTSDTRAEKEQTKPASEVTADGKTNRADQDAEEAAIVPYYNNFFTNYHLGPEDVISVSVFQQEKYSRANIKIPPSGRIYLALIHEGVFVNGKTPDQVGNHQEALRRIHHRSASLGFVGPGWIVSLQRRRRCRSAGH